MASGRRSLGLYPDLPNELNVGPSRRRKGVQEQVEEEEQDVTEDVTEDSSFDSSATEEVRYFTERNYQHDTRSSTTRAPVRSRAPSPSSSSEAASHSARARGRPHSSNSNGSWEEFFMNNMKELAMGAFLLLGIFFLLFANPSGNSAVQKPFDAMVLYNQGLKKLISRYGSQDRESWLVLRTAGKLVFNTSQVAEPAVVLLAGEPSTVACFAQELAAVALSAYGLDDTASSSTIIYGDSFRQSDGSAAKKVLDRRLRSTLSQMNVATLLTLDSLPGDSPLMLHSYCDHENAPFKDAFIILSTKLDTENAVGWHGCDAAVHAALGHRWKAENGLNEDKIGALLARMGNFVVCLRSQPDITC